MRDVMTSVHTTHMNTTHSIEVHAEGSWNRARCECGWQGHARIYAADARREGREHVASNEIKGA